MARISHQPAAIKDCGDALLAEPRLASSGRCVGRRATPHSPYWLILLSIYAILSIRAVPAAGNPVKRDVWNSGRCGGSFDAPSQNPAAVPNSIRTTAGTWLEKRRLDRRAVAFNQVTKTNLEDTLSAPRNGTQGLDIGSPNGLYAFIWSDGNPRLAQWDGTAKVVKNRWFLLRQPLAVGGCPLVDYNGTSVGEIFVSCGTRIVLSVNVTTSAGVKARSVAIDNTGTIRYYGPKPSSGTAPLLLTISPTTGNFTGSPTSNLKTWIWTTTTTRVSLAAPLFQAFR